MTTTYEKIEKVSRRLYQLSHLAAIAGWDEAVNMPKGSGQARAEALAELASLQHEILTAPEVGEWLDEAKETANALSEWQQANLRAFRRDYENATVVTSNLVEQMTLARFKSEQAWRQYRMENNWKAFLPYQKELFKWVQEEAALRAEHSRCNVYDALLSLYEPTLTTKVVDPLFQRLRTELPSMIDEIIDRQSRMNTVPPQGHYPVPTQKELSLEVMKILGFDFDRGRLDVSFHPFCGGVSDDVRITTRYNEQDFTSSLMGTIHESGHGSYEQNLPVEWRGQAVGYALGMAIHESQSLFFEMQIGRSKEFVSFLTPLVKKYFSSAGDAVSFLRVENLVQIFNKVEKGLIRVDADEATYPLHIILRYEIEKALLEGKAQIEDLPGMWNDKMQTLLGRNTLGNDKDGCMQDVHWPSGAFGYFPCYSLGALIAAQLFNSMVKDNDSLVQSIGQGNLTGVRQWLHDNVWQHGRRYDFQELLKNATGQELSADYFLKHLKQRYLS